jgi:hypothetical protein
MASLRPYTSLRSVIIILVLVCVGSMLTFRTYSQSDGAAQSPGKKAVAAAKPTPVLNSGGISSGRKPGVAVATPTPTPIFLAGVEQFGLGSGQIDLFTVTLGGNTAGSDTFTAGTPATLATTLSTNENKPDINNPADLRFDKSGDLLIANGGTSNADPGSFACVPAGAVTTGANSSTTITQSGTNPTQTGSLAYDSRDGSAAIANLAASSAKQLYEYLLSGSYSAAGAPRNLVASGFGAHSVVEVPALAAGTYAVALTTGTEEDPAHGGTTGNNKVALFSPAGVETDITDDTNFSIDDPYGLAFDSQNNQLVIANNSPFHKLLSFYTVSPVSLVKTVPTGFKNTYTATSPDGHVAVAWVKQFGYMQVQVYDNTAARNPIFGPIPYNGIDTAAHCANSTNYIYGNGTAIVNGLKWLSNTKLLVAVESNNSGTPTAKNGFYIYDITNSEVPAGFDDISCSAFAAAPINTGFVHITNHPFGVAIRGGTFVFADPAGTCNGNGPCFTSINSAIAAAAAGGVVNVFGGTYNEAVTLNNANVTVNIDANATVNSFTLTAGTLNAGGGLCSQAGGPALILSSGNWTNNGGTFNPGGGTVAFTGSSAQTIGGTNATTFNSVTVNNANGVTLSKDTTVGGTLTLTNGTLGVSTNTLTLNAGVSFTANGSITSSPNGTVNYNQASNSQNIAPGTYGNLTFSNFQKTFPSGSTVKIAGTFTTGTGGGHTITGSTIEFNGSAAQTLPSNFMTYNNLTLNNPTSTTGFAGLTVNSLLHVQQGTFTSASTYNNVQIDLGSTLAGVSATTINVSGNWTNNGTFTANSNTVNFNGASAQTISGSSNNNFNHLTINNTSGGVTLGSNQTVGGGLTLTSGALGIGSNTLTLNGAVSKTSGTLTSNANGTVNYNQSSGGQNVLAANYGNLTFSNFAKTLPNSLTVGIAGLFTTGAGGGHTITGSTVEFNGSAAQSLPLNFTTYNNLTLNNPAGTTGFDGLVSQGLLRVQAGTFSSGAATYKDVQIDSTKTLAATGTSALSVSGNWTNAGTFTANSSTVTFNGNNSTQTISGASTSPFNNLTINHTGTGGVTLGADESVGSALTLTSDLNASTFTLTQPATGTSAGGGDVVGNVKRTGFVSGGSANTLSFGNPDNQITVNSGTVPTNITVNLVKAVPSGAVAFPVALPAPVQRTYTITPTGGSGLSATLRLHYLDTELNGNTEAGLGLWRFANSVWARQGSTNADTSLNWVELGGVTQFSPWTFSSAKNNTTTSITSDDPDSSNLNQSVTVNFTVTSVVTGAPTPTGTVKVTVNDASGDTCTGPVAADGTGTCQLTLTTAGSKTLTATYQGDSNFNTSLGTAPHVVSSINIFARDGKVAEPASGTAPLLFTVTLSNPAPAGGVSVNYATADDTGGTNPATGGAACDNSTVDYVTTSGTLNFATGESIKTVSVTVCSDNSAPDTDETLLLNLSGATGGATILDNQAVGTITETSTPGTFLVSELRTSGPGGLGDDFVELYNNTDTPLTVAASDASAGFGVFKMGTDCNATPVLIATIPNGTIIPARGHYLVVGSQYSLGSYATGNQTMTSDIESDHNVAVFSTADIAAISTATRKDAAGFDGNTGGGVCDLLREGNTIPPVSGTTTQHSFFRKECDFVGGVGCTVAGNPKDTNDNSADFMFADTQGTFISGVPQHLGAPGPENLSSPIRRDATVLTILLDNTKSSSVSPNRVRDLTSNPGNNSTFGTLSIRRRVVNNSGASVTRLRFRIVEITTFPSPGGGVADLRAITSTNVSVSGVNDSGTCNTSNGNPATPCTVTVQGTTLEQPPTQPNGGGFNSSMSAGTVTLGTPLANNAAINVQFLLGVQTTGTFRFLIIIEALP